MKGLIYTIIIVLIISFMIGCKTKTVFVPVESVKTEYRDRLERDSIYLHDSVYMERWKSNDTIFLTKEKYKYLYRDKLIKDTVNIADTIRVPYPVIEYKEVNKISGFQNFQIWCGRILLLLIIGYLGFRYVKRFF